MGIVSRQGDVGKTKLFSGEEVEKSSLRVETYGTLDELIAFLGLAKAHLKDKLKIEELQRVQTDLGRLCGELATTKKACSKLDPLTAADIVWIENLLTAYEAKITYDNNFVIPGTNSCAAFLDVARTICRRFERRLIAFADSGEWEGNHAQIYINRLSDLLFLLARSED